METIDVYSLNDEQMDKFCNVFLAYRNYNFTELSKKYFHYSSAKPNSDIKSIYLFDKNANKVILKNNSLTLFNFCYICTNNCYDHDAIPNDDDLIICHDCKK